MADLNELLRYLIEQRGSDLHVKVGSVPHVRVQGKLRRTPFDASTMDEVAQIVSDLVPTARTRDLAERGEVSIAYALPGLGRFRLNVYRQRGSYGLSVRLIAHGAPAIESLDLPPIVAALAELESGLVLVSGPAASGKTTTAAAMLDHINRARAVHIVTLEDPIEVLLADRSSMVSQREIGVDVRSASEAMRRMSHLDPDVIFVSELNDADTIVEALALAASGRLVLATTPAASVAATFAYLVGTFEQNRQSRVRHGLASVLRSVVSQRLVGTINGDRLVPAVEVLVATREVGEAVIAGADPSELDALMAAGMVHGMQSMDQALVALVRDGKVSPSAAIAASHDPDRLGALLSGQRTASR